MSAEVLGPFDGGFAARVLGVPYWTLYSWDRSNLVKPSKRVGERQGTRRLYDFRDLLAVRTLVRLRQEGAPTRRIRKALRTLGAAPKEALLRNGARLIAVGDDVKLVHDDALLVSLVTAPMQTEARSILVVNIEREADALRERIRVERERPEAKKERRKPARLVKAQPRGKRAEEEKAAV